MIRETLAHLAIPIDSIQPHPRNVRQGDVGAISESLKLHGQYRPIVVQKSTGHILAGNHTYKAAKALKWKEVAVTYVDVNDDQAIRILLTDNKTSDLAAYDESALAELLKELAQSTTGLIGTMYDGDELDQIISDLSNNPVGEEAENAYTQKVAIPQYEIVGEEPDPKELVDLSRVDQLQSSIAKANIPDEVRQFLEYGTWRHARFNYRKIAEFYPHQSKEIQKLMEESVLVIIDADDAIAHGYAQFQKTINTLIEEDRDGED
jgi:hypothetical protein